MRTSTMITNTPAFATRSIHAGASPHAATGSRVMPIFHTNGFVFDDLDHGANIFALKRAGFSYSRGSNPNLAALEARIASLKAARRRSLAPGAVRPHHRAPRLVRHRRRTRVGRRAVRRFAHAVAAHGAAARHPDALGRSVRPATIEAAITAKTKAILVESVVNPSGDLVDLPAIAAIAQRRGVPLVVDNTLATPALLRPIEHGADVVIHSASKHLSGSGTVIGGLIIDAGRFPWRGDARFPLMSAPWEEYDRIVPVEAFPQTAFAVACRSWACANSGRGCRPPTPS